MTTDSTPTARPDLSPEETSATDQPRSAPCRKKWLIPAILAGLGLCGAAAVVAVAWGLWWLEIFPRRPSPLPPGPTYYSDTDLANLTPAEVQVNPLDLPEISWDKMQPPEDYGRVPQSPGVVQIPVSVAIDLLAGRLPRYNEKPRETAEPTPSEMQPETPTIPPETSLDK